MSIKMYCWRIKKGDFWKAAHALKQDALKNHGAMAIASRIRNDLSSNIIKDGIKAKVKYDEDMWRMFQANEAGLLALQVLDEGRTWLVRPLYHGFRFEDQIKNLELPFKPFWYDGRVDEGSPGAEKKVDWFDDKVNSGEYFIHIILGKDEPFNAVIYDMWPHGFEKTRNN